LILQKLELHNYRNYQARVFEPEARGNLIIGPNGCGKTNLLEAISYCGIGRSVRSHKDDEILAYGEPEWIVRAVFIKDNGSRWRSACTGARQETAQTGWRCFKAA
jgi:DNA replication and repair protein RecF